MTETIKKIIKSNGLLICPNCDGDGEGEIGYFCGHETTTDCVMCDSKGVVKSTKKQKQKKKCSICSGNGCGYCKKGIIEWKSFELYEH